jgi:hypothetical protein
LPIPLDDREDTLPLVNRFEEERPLHRNAASPPAVSHPHRPLASLAAAVVVVALLAAPASAQWTFTRVADLTTPVPGEGGATFEDLPTDYGEDAPSAAGTQVLFWGLWDASLDRHHGLFLFSGGALSRVVDEAQERPEGGGASYGDINPAASLAAGATVFVTDGNPFDGVYRVAGGIHALVADETTTVPGQGATTFVDLSPPSMDGGQVAFFGRSRTRKRPRARLRRDQPTRHLRAEMLQHPCRPPRPHRPCQHPTSRSGAASIHRRLSSPAAPPASDRDRLC